ncbi:MAG TPA: RNA polymerase sigma factor [Vicinamibacterales bacterium]|nr:RNA polymerase sigma factor [Vicinamibacterales bacterium]
MDPLTQRGRTPDSAANPAAAWLDAESSTRLLARARTGDREALDALFARYLPVLQRWASGRLPGWARDARETGDLVQDTLLQSLRHIRTFEPTREGALQAYLRQAVMNRIRDEIRRAGRRPSPEPLLDAETAEASPLEQAIGREASERYEAALQRLRAEDREAIIGRVEMGYGYEELAVVLGKPSPGAARVTAARALLKLAGEMQRGR